MKLRVSEIFGPTVQGEGRLIGTSCAFIRFAGCDYRCAWCDSLHAVLPEYVARTPQLDEGAIVEKTLEVASSVPWVVFSGGNPALFDLSGLVERFHDRRKKVMVETQGSIWKPWIGQCDDICISPKPPSAEYNITDPVALRNMLTEAFVRREIDTWSKVYLKVVVFNEADYEYAGRIRDTFPWLPLFLSVGNPMPPGPDAGYSPVDISTLLERLRWLMERVAADTEMAHKARVLPQLHVLAWGNERGR